MPEFEMICLANSRKYQGRCLAGIRTDGGGWIRPVGWNEKGFLLPGDYWLDNDTEPQVLDLIRIQCLQPRPLSYHPENWLVQKVRWQLLSRPAPPDTLKSWCTPLCSGSELFGCTNDSIPLEWFQRQKVESSLALVAPKSLKFLVTSARTGEKRLRVGFTLESAQYELPLTDPVWENKLRGFPARAYMAKKLEFHQQGKYY